MRVAIVIPTLDEEESLTRHLPAVMEIGDEVIVSDGGSKDGTTAVARSLGARVVQGPSGRGPQLNRGAAAATAATQVFVFLHADTTLPEGAREAILEAVHAGAEGGAFLMRFDRETPLLKLASRLINLRTRLTRAPLGDQAQFATRAAFDALNGFQEWPILEDLDFIRRLGRRGRLTLLPAQVATASRRYLAQGVLRTASKNWLIWLFFFFGASPQRLARLYRHIR